jgi:glycosyltransferase involved in cell wall biosynthesis
MIIYFPHTAGSGGPGSFQVRFEDGLKKRGWTIGYAGDTNDPDIVLVVGGTRKLFWLLKMKLKGIPIIYRLDGINWLHRKKKVGVKLYALTEVRNWISKYIHAFLADKIIYQSKFVESWWNRSGWRKRRNSTIIYNGVEIPTFNDGNFISDEKRLVILEGTIDYTPYAVQLINELAEYLPNEISIHLYGQFSNQDNKDELHEGVLYQGFLERSKVFNVLRGSVYLSLDINPACPNTVIEALASGAPVVAFDTGALPELVKSGAGGIVEYGSDPWKLGYPDTSRLMEKIVEAFKNYSAMSKKAHDSAINCFDIEMMIDKYEYELECLNLHNPDKKI